jgi:hypothetical protein
MSAQRKAQSLESVGLGFRVLQLQEQCFVSFELFAAESFSRLEAPRRGSVFDAFYALGCTEFHSRVQNTRKS